MSLINDLNVVCVHNFSRLPLLNGSLLGVIKSVCVCVCLRHFLISGIDRNCRTHEAPRDLKFGMYAN